MAFKLEAKPGGSRVTAQTVCGGGNRHGGTGQGRAGTDLEAALEFLLGIVEHLDIQEESESVVHGAEATALRGWG